MGSTSEYRVQKKELVNQKREQQKSPSLTNRKKQTGKKTHTQKHIEPQGTKGLLKTKQRNKKTHSICVIKVQEAEEKKGKAKKGTKRLIIIKLLKTNGKNYRKQPEKNDLNCRRKTIRITIDLSSETMEAQRKWHNTFQMLKEENSQPKILHSVKISFR